MVDGIPLPVDGQIETWFQHFIEHINVGVVVHGRHAEVRISNPAARRMLGLTEDQLLGRTPSDPEWRIIHKDGSPFPVEERPVYVAMETLKPVEDVVMGVYRPDSADWVWLLVNAAPEVDSKGVLLYVVITFSDITAMKQAEATLRESEARNRLHTELIQNIQDAVFSTDMARRVLTWNTGAERMYGWTAKEAIGRFSPELTALRINDELQQQIQQRMREDGLWNGEIIQSSRSGQTMLVRSTVSMLRSEDGRPIGYLMLNRNITEFRRTARQAAAVAVKERAIETLRQVLSNVSHDLRTPLSVMTTSLYLLRRKLGGDHPELRHIDNIEEQVQHMTQIVEDVAEITRLDDETVQFEFIPVDVNHLVRDVLDGHEGALTARQHTLQVDLAPKLPTIQADQMWLGRAIKNILANAIAYTPNNGLITARTWTIDREIVIEIADNGIGIEAEHVQHIFERFYRIDDARPANKGGVGLGLPIVRRIVEAHGGRVDVESKPDQGSAFRIVLPLSE